MKEIIQKIDEVYKRYDYVENKGELLLFLIKILTLKFLVDNGRVVLDRKNAQKLRTDFTVGGIMRVWSRGVSNSHHWTDEGKLTLSGLIWEDVKRFIEDTDSFENKNASVIGELYEECLHRSHKKSQGIFYTPDVLAEYMVSLCVSVVKKEKILDPACGSGSLLSAAYDYILKNTKDLEKEAVHKRLLQKSLCGVDKDPLAVLVTRITLALKGPKYCYPAGIMVGDCLDKSTADFKDSSFDVVIGNPPYVGHKEIDSDYMKRLKALYSDVYQNKGDLSYCFFKRGYELLKDKGRLLFLTSRYFMEAYNARALRQFIREHFMIRRLIDFNGLRVISGIGIDPALSLLIKGRAPARHAARVSRFFVQKGKLRETSVYIEDLESGQPKLHEDFETRQSQMDDALWRLYGPMTKTIVEKIEKRAPFTLENLVDSFQGIITGNDKAFIFDDNELDAYNFNPQFLHPWIKNRNVHAFEITPPGKQILYTNEIDAIERHPYEEVYLKQFREKLSGRRECMSGRLPWYAIQWGRNLECFMKKKIVFPYKAKDNRFAIDENRYFFSADIYGLTLKNRLYSQVNEEFLVMLLNSRLYNFYFKSFAKKLGVDLYEYYPNTVLKLKIPDVSMEISDKFKDFYDKIINLTETTHKKDREALLFEADRWIYGYFDINEEEISWIEKQ